MAEYVPLPVHPIRIISSKAITLHPLKSVGNLRERYSEATADVVFTGRLPAHKAVLSVASSVFFKRESHTHALVLTFTGTSAGP